MSLHRSRITTAVILAVLAIGIFSAKVPAQTYLFNRASFGVGNQPEAMALGDFNGDGKSDVAVANEMDNTVSILLGKPDGTFAAKVDYPVGRSPIGIVAVDLNGDGRLDLAVTNEYDYTVSILLGNGDGTFRPAVSFPAGGTFPTSIVAGDFSRNGKVDLAFVNLNYGSTPTVAVLLGNGDGTLQTAVTYALISYNATASLITADFNGDGNLDLAASVGNSSIAVLLGNGDGSFQNPVDYATGASVKGIAVGDFNTDGKLDVAIVSSDAYEYSVLLGNGDGTFQAPQTNRSSAAPSAITAADVNGDGKVDLVFSGGGGFAVLLGNGNGTFQTEADYSGGGGLSSMAINDFTGDGKLDLAGTIPGQPGQVVVLPGRGDGSFLSYAVFSATGQVQYDYPTPGVATAAADFNGDGHQDLAVVDESQNAVSILLNNGDGTFQPHVEYTVGAQPLMVVAADLNRDGNPDLVVVNSGQYANPSTGSISILMGNGDGTFRPHVDYAAPGDSVAVGDLNGDGVPDLAVLYSWGGTVTILLGDGDGTFRIGPSYSTAASSPTILRGAAVIGDFNGDGKSDLAVTGYGYPNGSVNILLGNGDGTFHAGALYSAGESQGDLTTADLNNDGKLDLAVTSEVVTYVLLGNGDGTFQPASAACPYWGSSIAAVDINGDGRPDLVMAGGTGGVDICLNNGDGTYRSGVYGGYSGGTSSAGAIVADFDGDGTSDIAVANIYEGTVTVLFNRPIVAFYPSKMVFANEGQGTTSPVQLLTVSNPGSASLAISSIAASSPFAQTNTCGATLAVGANCTVSVTFAPPGTGEQAGAITFVDSAPGSPQSIPLSGLAVNGAAVALSPATMTFGSLPAGTTSSAITATLQNTGNAVLTGIGIATNGDFLESNTCGTSLAVGAHCSIVVKFMPTGRGMREGSLTVSSNANGGPNAISLEGVGLAPVMTFSTTSLNFGNQLVGVTSAVQTAILTSAGDLNLNITGVSANGDFAQTNNCNLPLAPGSSCTVSVTMTPAAVGTHTGSLTFTDNEPLIPTPVVLTGSATYAVPRIVPSLSPATAAPGSAAFTLTVSGSGFALASVVQWSGSPLPTTYVSATQLTAAVPASDVAQAGTALVAVTNPAPGGGVSNKVAFEIMTGTTPPSSSLECSLMGGSQICFAKSDIAAGRSPDALVKADFNGDGKADLALANGSDDTVSILLGKGDGKFQSLVNYPVGGDPDAIVAADFNHDGKPDLVVANALCLPNVQTCTGGSLSILLGTGDGAFQPETTISTGYYPQTIAVADFNGDGNLDLAVGVDDPHIGTSNAGITIFLGNGDGTFQAGYQIGRPVDGTPASLVAADYNGDGKVDLVAAYSYGGFLLFYAGNGDGTFQTGLELVTGWGPYSLVAADFNGDGDLDVASASGGLGINSVSVLLGNGNGIFQSHVDYPTGIEPISLATADVDGDGMPDLIVADSNANIVSILLGNGNGTFQAKQDFSTGVGPLAVAVGDFNGDGRQDVAVANSDSNTVSILLQAPVAGLSPASLTFAGQAAGTSSTPQTVTLKNTGSAALQISSIAFTGPNAADFGQTGNCGTTLAAGATCSINVTFTPSVDGAESASLAVADNAAGSPHTLPITGTGIAPLISFNVQALNFGQQMVGTPSAAQTESITNPGTANLTISAVTVGGTNAGDFAKTADTCRGATLLPQGACTVAVTFTPAAMGNRSATLTVTDNAPGSPQTETLTGTGVAPVVSLGATSLTFSSQALGTTSSPQSVTLNNTGTASLTLNNISASGDFAETGNCSASVPAGGNCTINVTFKPTAPGNRTGTLTITDNAAGSPHSVSLTGTGAGPLVSLSATSLTFSPQTSGTTSAAQTITVTNAGNASLTFTSIGTAAPFAIASSGTTCSTSTPVAASTSCTVALDFAPTVGGSASGSLSFSDNAVGSPQSVALNGTGQDFSFAPPTGSPTNTAVTRGQPATYTLSVGGQGGLAGTVTFTCSGAPSEANCTVSPNPVTAGNTPTNVTVSVTTTAPSGGLASFRPVPPPPSPAVRIQLSLAVMLLLAGWIGARHPPFVRRWPSVFLPLAAGLLLTVALAACGGGGGGGGGAPSNPGTPPGTYTLTVTGTTGSGATALSHSVTLTLTVS